MTRSAFERQGPEVRILSPRPTSLSGPADSRPGASHAPGVRRYANVHWTFGPGSPTHPDQLAAFRFLLHLQDRDRPSWTCLFGGASIHRMFATPPASPRAVSPTHTTLCWYTALWRGPRHAPFGAPGDCPRLPTETGADARAETSRIRAGTREMTHCIRLADIVYLQVDGEEILSEAKTRRRSLTTNRVALGHAS